MREFTGFVWRKGQFVLKKKETKKEKLKNLPVFVSAGKWLMLYLLCCQRIFSCNFCIFRAFVVQAFISHAVLNIFNGRFNVIIDFVILHCFIQISKVLFKSLTAKAEPVFLIHSIRPGKSIKRTVLDKRSDCALRLEESLVHKWKKGKDICSILQIENYNTILIMGQSF